MILKPLSPAARLLVCFGLTAPSLLVTVACIFTFQDMHRMNSAFGWVRHALQVENRVHQLVLDVHEFEAGQRGYLFTGRRSHRESFNAAAVRVPADLEALGQDIPLNSEQRGRFLNLRTLVARRLNLARQTVDLKKSGLHDAAHKLARAELRQDDIDSIRRLAQEMRKYEELQLVGRDAALASRRTGHARWLYGLLVLNLSSLACTLFLLHRLDKTQSLARICAWSKRIEHEGQWISFEEYLSRRFSIDTTHTISPAELSRVSSAIRARSRNSGPEATASAVASGSPAVAP